MKSGREVAILGVGMNLNVERFPTVLKDLATSLLLETHRLMFPFCFLDCFLNSLEELYVLSQVSQSSLIEIVKESFPLTGKRVRLIDMGGDRMVRVRNIDYQGRLIVESEGGAQQIITPGGSVSITCLTP